MDLSPPGCVETAISILDVLQGIRLRSKPGFAFPGRLRSIFARCFMKVPG